MRRNELEKLTETIKSNDVSTGMNGLCCCGRGSSIPSRT